MRYLLIIFSLFFYFQGHAIEISDSLKAEMDAAPDDSVRTHMLLNEADRYEGVDYEKAKEFALKAKELAEKASYHRGVGSSLIMLGRFSMQMGKDEESLSYYFQAIRICEKHNMPIGLANAYAQISAVYQ